MVKAFEPKFMKVGVLTAALQELTPRNVRDPDPDKAIEEWLDFAKELGVNHIQISAALHPTQSDIPAEAMLDPVANTLDLRKPFDKARASRVQAAMKSTGVVSAVRQDSALDYALRVVSLAGLSMPSFWLGMVIILSLVSWLGWIPPLTYVRPTENLWLHTVQFMLPALAVGYRSSALIMRITRSAMLEVLREDYIRTARAKGQHGRAVVWRHALKNAVLPVVTVVGIEFAFLIGGLVVTETVFNLPGVARFLVQAILWRDYPIVQTLVMFIAIVVILSNLLVDMLYGVLDPRVRYG